MAKVWAYLLPTLLVIIGTSGYALGAGWIFMLALYLLALLSAAYITITGLWDGKTGYWYSVSSLAEKLPRLTTEQRAAMSLACPELSLLFGRAGGAVVTIGDSGVDFGFFVELMEHSDGSYTWAKRDIEATEFETRDTRRIKWDKITTWLMTRRYLVQSPVGQNTYAWRGGAYSELYNTLVIPFAKLVNAHPVPLPELSPLSPERGDDLQTWNSETERIA